MHASAIFLVAALIGVTQAHGCKLLKNSHRNHLTCSLLETYILCELENSEFDSLGDDLRDLITDIINKGLSIDCNPTTLFTNIMADLYDLDDEKCEDLLSNQASDIHSMDGLCQQMEVLSVCAAKSMSETPEGQEIYLKEITKKMRSFGVDCVLGGDSWKSEVYHISSLGLVLGTVCSGCILVAVVATMFGLYRRKSAARRQQLTFSSRHLNQQAERHPSTSSLNTSSISPGIVHKPTAYQGPPGYQLTPPSYIIEPPRYEDIEHH